MKNFLKKIKVLSLIILTFFGVSVLGVNAMNRPRPYSVNVGRTSTVFSIIERLEEMEDQVDLPETDQEVVKKELIALATKFVNRSSSDQVMCLIKSYRDCDFASAIMNKYFLDDFLEVARDFYYKDCYEYQVRQKNRLLK